MPAKRKDDDGPVTGVQAFAAELRAQREAAGLTQAQLAKLMGYSESVIAKLETCRTIPSPQHAAQADGALRTPGTFRRLRQAMLNGSNESVGPCLPGHGGTRNRAAELGTPGGAGPPADRGVRAWGDTRRLVRPTVKRRLSRLWRRGWPGRASGSG